METRAASAFITQFIEAYYQQQDVSKVMGMLDPQIRWSSVRCQSILNGKTEVEKMLTEALNQKNYRIKVCEFKMGEIKEESNPFLVHYEIDALLIGESYQHSLTFFGSLTVQERKNTFIIKEVYMSMFKSEEQFVELLYKEMKDRKRREQNERDYQDALKLKQVNDNLEVLTNNVPGGIFRCLEDEALTLLYVSDGFLKMLGYTRQEIKDQFDDSFRKMIDPRDRDRIEKEVIRQMALGSTKQIEYRILHKDHRSIWVLDNGQLIEDPNGEYPSYYCIIIDITEEKKIREELSLALERYDIIMNQTNDVVFDWDILNDKLKYSRGLERIIPQTIPENNIKEFVFEASHPLFHQADIPKLKRLLEKIRNKNSYVEEELRLMNSDHQYRWWRLRVSIQFDKNEQPIRAIGIIIDIDQEKQHSQFLLSRSQEDALTGIYNKMTAQRQIKSALTSLDRKKLHALMIIDIDNFKEINDRLGHLFGDAVLSDIARRMKNVFGRHDIIGRIGGDEFIIFVRDMQDMETIKIKAGQMIYEMHELQLHHDKQVPISCSIGIALIPRDGDNFKSLFQKADQALYHAKKAGKNQYALYDESIIKEYFGDTKVSSVVNEKIDSNENNKVLNGQLTEYVFRVLYNSKDLYSAIESVLEIVGLQFDVSRVYIFESSHDGIYCKNTFEWCNSGIEPQIDYLKHVSYRDELGRNYMDNFNEDGIFYCADIHQLPKYHYEIVAKQGIKSMLQCAVLDNGEFRGYVGFDECRQNRYWTQDQIEALVFISEILSVFLLKNRAESVLKQESTGLLDLLNNQNSWIYVIDPKSYEILFLNKKTNEYCPTAKIGMLCYNIFMERTSPCPFCPLKRLFESKESQNDEIYIPTFKVWVDVDATCVKWKGKEAVMLSCRDINRYKQK